MASFSITKQDHESVTVKVEGISSGDTVRIFVRLESDASDTTVDKTYTATGSTMTKTLDGLEPDTEYLVNVKINSDDWLGAWIFSTYEAPATYTIYLDAQGGSGGDDEVEVEADTDLPDIDPPTRSGYVFKGYFTQTGGKGVQYYDEYGEGTRTYDGSYESITIYAYWVQGCIITLDKQGGRGGDSSVTVENGEIVPDVDPPTRSGYVFMGYFTQTGGAGVKYYDADGTGLIEWDWHENITIFAYWRDPSALFAWTTEKVQDKPFNLTAAEWNALAAFVNGKRSTAYSFTAAVKEKPFTAAMYNQMVAAIGTGTEVEKGDPITADLLNALVDNANNM